MTRLTCHRELEVVRALRAGGIDDALRTHMANCPACQEASLVAEALLPDAAWLARQPGLPDPSNVWIKAQILARWHAAERATRPIAAVEWVAIACGILLLAVGVSWSASLIGSWFDATTMMAALSQRPTGNPVSAASSIITASSLLLIVPMLVGIYLAWAEQ